MVRRIKNLFETEGWLSYLGYVLSFHAAALGLSFALDTSDARRTLLYQSIDAFPVLEPELFGWALAISGIIAFIGYLARKASFSRRVVKYASIVQFMIYLFMTFLYLFNSLFWYAASIAVPWVPLVYIVSTVYFKIVSERLTEEQERAYFNLPPK
jgi:phosphoglycerol transferase MdoB-like AlkP superfamily enzyme